MSGRQPSNKWVRVFPGPRIPEVLAYVQATWAWLQSQYPEKVSYANSEPDLTDNLCEALNDYDRRLASDLGCDFLAEIWELRRDASGKVTRVARTDIRVILGVSGTPHLVMEFKKLNGTGQARWLYCFDGMIRFIEGTYSVGHDFAVMCGLTCVNIGQEDTAMGHYISQQEYVARLHCVADSTGAVVSRPSPTAPGLARFDTVHMRPSLNPPKNIVLLHVLMNCPAPT